jgi:hypothetical protein
MAWHMQVVNAQLVFLRRSEKSDKGVKALNKPQQFLAFGHTICILYMTVRQEVDQCSYWRTRLILL